MIGAPIGIPGRGLIKDKREEGGGLLDPGLGLE